MPEAEYTRDDNKFLLLAGATLDAGQLIQLPTGEAGFLDDDAPVSSGAYTDDVKTRGKVTVEKATGVVLLAEQEVYWDHSANKLTYQKVNDRDFFAGVVVADASSAAITAVIDLNKRQRFDIDLARDFFLSTIIGTQALNTMGLYARGGGWKHILSTTSEAQKVDQLSRDRFDKNANWIAEFVLCVPNDGAGTVVDVNLAVANGTHATDADSIAEFCGVHLDANSTNISAASRDGTTTVAITDTTLDYTEGSAVANRVHVLIDGRDPADVQIYVNGALVLGSTVFRLDNATGPLGLLIHTEKTSAADAYELDIEKARVWFSEQ